MSRAAISDVHLPEGVWLAPLTPHRDARGDLTEIFRQSWIGDFHPLQWNLVRSAPNSLRGFHVHPRHHDYLVMIEGTMQLALKDMRCGSPTENLAATVTLDAVDPKGIVVPPGVGHGFYFPAGATYIYSISDYWSLDDEIGCRWDDPDLGIAWGARNVLLSHRDETAGTYGEMAAAFARAEHLFHEKAGPVRA